MYHNLEVPYRVLLPKWVFQGDNRRGTRQNIQLYMERYPHYQVIDIDGVYAICIKMDKRRGS